MICGCQCQYIDRFFSFQSSKVSLTLDGLKSIVEPESLRDYELYDGLNGNTPHSAMTSLRVSGLFHSLLVYLFDTPIRLLSLDPTS